MKRTPLRLLCLLVAAAAVGCSSGGSTGVRETEIVPDIEIEPGQEFSLSPGETAHVRGTDVLVHFDRITEDYRCPIDVQCPWQGNAAARLEVSSRVAEFAPQPIVLNSDIGPREQTILGVTVRLVDVDPDPISTERTDPASYRIELVVIR